MIHKGVFGYIIGRKKRFMYVENDANLLWRILVREIYVIMKHFQSKETFLEAFNKIKIIKDITLLKSSVIEKCKIFLDQEDKENFLKYCQSSFINLLEAGHILITNDNLKECEGFCFVLDFNKWEAQFYKDSSLLESASIEEIMDFEEMPSKTYNEIVLEMRDKFNSYSNNVNENELELKKLYKLKDDAHNQSALNIEEKLDKIIDDTKWKLKELHMNRRVFYNRLIALDLIEI
jgi:hypothetical protein